MFMPCTNIRTAICIGAFLASIAGNVSSAEAVSPTSTVGTIRRVPSDYATIQSAIDAANEGDTVLVAPGTYHEGLRIAGKSIRLVSDFDTSGDKDAIRKSILDGKYTDSSGGDRTRDQIILVEASAGPKTEIVGFTIRNGDDGISCQADIRIAHNFFTGNDDAIDYEGGGGVCEHNRFEKNTDDAVDYDLDCDAIVQHNEIVDNEDDGIEIRFQDYRGDTLQLTICHNVISGNGEDGIQIIDYPGASDRHIRIERNVIANNAMAGIGCMEDAITKEDYRGAPVPEPIDVVNNTIIGNEFGITGGSNLVAFNNVIAKNRQIGMKAVGGNSIAAYNLFWRNGTDFDHASKVLHENTLRVEPQLASDFRPRRNSPCVGAGTFALISSTRNVVAGSSEAAEDKIDIGALDAN